MDAWAVVDQEGNLYPGPRGVAFIYATEEQAQKWIPYLGARVIPVEIKERTINED